MFLDYFIIPLAILTVIFAFVLGYDIGRNVGAKAILDYVDRLIDCVSRECNVKTIRAIKATRPKTE